MKTESSSGPGGVEGARGPSEHALQIQWSMPKPEQIPRPTSTPAATALGVTLIAFGALTSAIVSVGGALFTAVAIARWIKEMHDAAEE
jgi:hypothetical protein